MATLSTIVSLPESLRPVAARWISDQPSTQADRNSEIMGVLGKAGLVALGLRRDEARGLCEEAAAWGKAERRGRNARRIAARFGGSVDMFGRAVTAEGRIPRSGRQSDVSARAKLPQGKPIARLHRLIGGQAVTALRGNYRLPVSGDHGDETYSVTTDPAEIGVGQSQSTRRDLYRGRYKGWAASVTDTILVIPHAYLTRVIQRGLLLVDGLLTLDASPMDGAPHGVELYHATWVVQGRGYALGATTGYIARQGGISYHGSSAQKALAGLKRKLDAAEWQSVLRTTQLESIIARFADRMNSLKVCVSDAAAIGACDYGIRSWCHTVDLDYAAGCATLRQVYDAYRAHPRPEARAAILYALRRCRAKLAA